MESGLLAKGSNELYGLIADLNGLIPEQGVGAGLVRMTVQVLRLYAQSLRDGRQYVRIE